MAGATVSAGPIQTVVDVGLAQFPDETWLTSTLEVVHAIVTGATVETRIY